VCVCVCVCLIVWDLQNTKIREPWPELGAAEKKIYSDTSANE